MPFHTIDPLKKNNKYKAIGNRSKNELYPTKQIKPKDRKKKNKNKNHLDFIIKGMIDKAHITKPDETVTNPISIIETNLNNNTVDETIIKKEIIEKIVENELVYLLPTLLAI